MSSVRERLERLGYKYDGVLDQYVLPHPDAPGWVGVHWAVADHNLLQDVSPEEAARWLERYAEHARRRTEYIATLKERSKRENVRLP